MGKFNVNIGLSSVIFFGAVFFCGCSSSRKVLNTEQLTLIDMDSFYKSGLAELEGKYIFSDPNLRQPFDGGRIYYDNIVTGEHQIQHLMVDTALSGEVKVKGWVRMPSPRIAVLWDIRNDSYPIYLQGCKRLEFNMKDGVGDYSGDLGKVNMDLSRAPQFNIPDSLSQVFENNTDIKWGDALEIYEAGEREWKRNLRDYLADPDISPVARNILEQTPAYTKAKWLMLNEKRMLTDSAADYSALTEFLKSDNPYIMAGNGPGGLLKLIASSELLKSLSEERSEGGSGNVPEAVRRYLERYNGLLVKLGIDRMPDPLQLCISQLLCSGGVLERSGSKEQALAILDRIAPEFLPNKEIEREMREYIDRIFHDERVVIPDTKEGDILRELVAPYAGKNVIIDFWGYQCPPCMKEMAATRRVRENNRNNPDWVILYVTNTGTTPKREYEKIREKYLVGDESVLLPVEDGARLGAFFDLGQIPRHVLIGRDGTIRDSNYSFKFDGNGEWVNCPKGD